MISLLTEFLPHIIGALTVIGGALGLYYKGKGKGRQEAEHEQQKIDAAAADRRDDARREYERTGASDRLRKGDF
ncbi:hypothetical protein ACFOW6_01595 [Fodinicurvata halophila]|uniref:Uncharacterized protein n=1 Tax=Fodinicurvata halophila TaxID=1419723 RepID=A0ABV8UG23_9PROT